MPSRSIKPSGRKKKPRSGKRKPSKHPWRLCSPGQHWVKFHSRSTAPLVHGYCRNNPSGKDQIYPDELKEIAETRFSKLGKSYLPHHGVKTKELKDGYDHLIGGWTRYWNEVFRPKVPLDPDFVKALISTESTFRPDIVVTAGKRAGKARGLMQVTDWTVEILKDEDGELLDHLVDLDQQDMLDPSLNIAAGVRWLFRKRETASAKLGRKASWVETAAEYKDYLGPYRKTRITRRSRSSWGASSC